MKVEQDQNQENAADSNQVKQLNRMLQYQEGSIVSRVLLKNKGGTVTLFAFDKGESLSEHTAPFDVLLVCIEGEGEIEISGENYGVRQGEAIIMPANSPHAVRAATKFKMLLIMIRVEC